MASLYLDVNGHLHWFLGVPPQREPQTNEQVNVDWSIPFHAAGLDLKDFQPVTSTWVPLHAYDEPAAWDCWRSGTGKLLLRCDHCTSINLLSQVTTIPEGGVAGFDSCLVWHMGSGSYSIPRG